MKITKENYRSNSRGVNEDDDMSRITIDIEKIKSNSLFLFLEEYSKNTDNQNFLDFLDEYSLKLHHFAEESPTTKILINMLKDQKIVPEISQEEHDISTNNQWKFV